MGNDQFGIVYPKPNHVWNLSRLIWNIVKFGTFIWGYFKLDLGYELKFNLEYGQA